MDPLERVTVGYSTMCDMVQEIIGAERIMREGVKATDAVLAYWEGERNAMMRVLSYILALSPATRHKIFLKLRDEIVGVTDPEPAGDILIRIMRELVDGS